MNALVLGLAALVLGIAIHAVLLRFLRQRWRLTALPAALLAAFCVLTLTLHFPDAVFTVEDAAVALILTLSAGFAYALLLVGVIFDSPTLALVNAVETCEPLGMPVTSFASFAASHPFFHSRLSTLIAAGELGVEGDELLLTGKAVYLLRLGQIYRRLRSGSDAVTG